MSHLSSVELLNFLYFGFHKIRSRSTHYPFLLQISRIDSTYLILMGIIVLETQQFLMRDCENNHKPTFFAQNCIWDKQICRVSLVFLNKAMHRAVSSADTNISPAYRPVAELWHAWSISHIAICEHFLPALGHTAPPSSLLSPHKPDFDLLYCGYL